MEILLVPHPVLRQKANKLKSISKEDIKIANQMMETMIKVPGVGLAANQVGILKQIIVLPFKELMELIVNKLEKMFFQIQKAYPVQHLKKCLLVLEMIKLT